MFYIRVAILLTCYNRKETTLACLSSLYEQELPEDVSFNVYLVDDGSTDGTEQTVSQHFPRVKIIFGTGSLFWCGGMRLAWEEASQSAYDFFLWLNDDTQLLSNAIDVLVKTAASIKDKELIDSIIVGSCIDPETREYSYGGRLLNKSELITPSEFPQECEMINGNIVLVPAGIFKCIGNLSPEFTHTSGDNDYGLRAKKKGFKLWIAPGYQGLCAKNENMEQWANKNIPIKKRLKLLHSPKGQPFYETYIFAKRHKGFLWPLDLIKLYSRVFFPKIYSYSKNILSKFRQGLKKIHPLRRWT